MSKKIYVGDELIASSQIDASDVVSGTLSGDRLAGFLYAGTRYYTSDGTFDKADPLGTGDINLRAIRVRLVGGGGGGAGVNGGFNGGGGGGGGGGYSEKFVTDLSAIKTIADVTVGAGGAGSSVGGTNASPGGTSVFEDVCSATGGEGSIRAGDFNPRGGAGGVGSDGDINIVGSGGGGASTGGNPERAGMGGSSQLGGGAPGRARKSDVGLNGSGGGQYGGGGGGAVTKSATGFTGGGGAGGIVIVDCFV